MEVRPAMRTGFLPLHHRPILTVGWFDKETGRLGKRA